MCRYLQFFATFFAMFRWIFLKFSRISSNLAERLANFSSQLRYISADCWDSPTSAEGNIVWTFTEHFETNPSNIINTSIWLMNSKLLPSHEGTRPLAWGISVRDPRPPRPSAVWRTSTWRPQARGSNPPNARAQPGCFFENLRLEGRETIFQTTSSYLPKVLNLGR